LVALSAQIVPAPLHVGEVRGGRAALGSLGASAPPGAEEGAPVRAFVRPHAVDLRRETEPKRAAAVASTTAASTETSPGAPVASARVARISRVGFMIRIELQLDDGQPLTVDLTKDKLAELGVEEGDRVFVNLRETKIFVQDYAI